MIGLKNLNMPEVGIWKLEQQATKEFLNSDKKYWEFFKNDALRKFEKDAKQKPAIYYYTYLGNDYDRNIVRIICSSFFDGKIILTAPKYDIDRALEDVIEYNSHLELEVMDIGFNVDDFVNNRKSIMLWARSIIN